MKNKPDIRVNIVDVIRTKWFGNLKRAMPATHVPTSISCCLLQKFRGKALKQAVENQCRGDKKQKPAVKPKSKRYGKAVTSAVSENLKYYRECLRYENNDRPAVTRMGKGSGLNSLTYTSLFEAVEKYRESLFRAGLSDHDRVALFCEDSVEYIIMALAILDTGAVIVPISPSLSSNELESLCRRIKVKFMLSEKKSDQYPLVLKDKILDKLYLYRISETVDYSQEYLAVENPAFIRFSSGTTGESKGVLLTHQAIIDRTDAADTRLNISSDDTIGWFLSMSFHFVVSILLFLRKGAHIVLSQENFPVGIIDIFEKIKPTFLYASPFHYQMLAANNNIASKLLSDVRMAVVTAVSLNKKTENEFFRKFNIHLSQAYGIIEVGLPFINDRYDDEYICSVGKIIPSYELMIKNPDEKGQGIILLKGKGMYHAYTSPWKIRSEWFNTGDIGYLKDSYLFISGRAKNLINFAGMKIFPEEMEEVILSYRGVSEVRVFAEPHNIYGQLPIAEVVMSSGSELDVFKLKKYCMQKLDSYKIPKEFIEVESIKRTHSNKIKRA